ncbi:MAG: hydroxyacid dehydrogenase [Candidatus Glassbacteria bacterium]
MKVLVSDPISQDSLDVLKSSGEFKVDVITELDEDGLVETISPYECIVVRSRTKVTKKVIEAAGNLKLIVRGGVGLDNIDLEAAKEKGIKVLNTPGTNAESVAELTIGLMLCLARQIPQAHATLVEGRWEKKKFRGFELGGKTLGIIGMGRIGRSVSAKAAALGMTVLGYDPYVEDDVIRRAKANPATLDEIRRASDFLTIHVPISQETKNLVDSEFLAGVKDGIRIINCARGGIVDEAALLKAIESGKVGGAAFDVFESEPPGKSPLFEKECVIGTPHIGAATVEAQERVGKEVVRVIMEFNAGK